MNERISAHDTRASKLFSNADCSTDQPKTMTGEECFARFHQKLKATENKALRNFNKLDEDFKFVVLTLANRNNPGAFRSDEVGKPYEYFDMDRRKLIIASMNKISRWGGVLPRHISIHECFLAN